MEKLLSQAVASLLSNPSMCIESHVQAVTDDAELRERLFAEICALFSPSPKNSGPTIAERCGFAFRLLRVADKKVRAASKIVVGSPIDKIQKALGNLGLSFAPSVELIREVLTLLHLEPDGRWLSHYRSFLMNAPVSKQIRIGDSGNFYENNLRHILWWITRNLRVKYIEVSDGQVSIDTYAATVVMKRKLESIYGRQLVSFIPDLEDELEDSLNRWLEYSSLAGPVELLSADRLEVAETFIKQHELITEVIVLDHSMPSDSQQQIQEIERQLTVTMSECERLRQQIIDLETRTSIPSPQKSPPAPTEDSSPGDLVEIARMLDRKYPFDSLHQVVLTGSKDLSLRNFLSHLLYSLRMRGLTQYPDAEEVLIPYDDSGLYTIADGSISPGLMAKCRIEKKGWCIRKSGRIHPIRKPVVSIVEVDTE